MQELKNLELHEFSYNRDGEIEQLNFEAEFSFVDFLNKNELTDQQYNIINSFSFNTVVINNYHYWYFNKMMLEINQLNYGTKRYDITCEDDLRNELLTCVEFDDFNTDEQNSLVELFIQSIDTFIDELHDNKNKYYE